MGQENIGNLRRMAAESGYGAPGGGMGGFGAGAGGFGAGAGAGAGMGMGGGGAAEDNDDDDDGALPPREKWELMIFFMAVAGRQHRRRPTTS